MRTFDPFCSHIPLPAKGGSEQEEDSEGGEGIKCEYRESQTQDNGVNVCSSII
jgi:hypothetical protein